MSNNPDTCIYIMATSCTSYTSCLEQPYLLNIVQQQCTIYTLDATCTTSIIGGKKRLFHILNLVKFCPKDKGFLMKLKTQKMIFQKKNYDCDILNTKNKM